MPVDLPPVSVPQFQQSLPVEEVAFLESFPGEERQAFIERAATALDLYTQETQFEGCSRLWVSPEGNRWGVGLVSNRAHIGCTLLDRVPFEGLVVTDESIHSHPTLKRYRTNKSDQVFSGMKDRVNKVRPIEGARFSNADFKSGPGYMVHDGKLYHQAGGETVAHGALPLPENESRAAQALPRALKDRLRARREAREASIAATIQQSPAVSEARPLPLPGHRH